MGGPGGPLSFLPRDRVTPPHPVQQREQELGLALVEWEAVLELQLQPSPKTAHETQGLVELKRLVPEMYHVFDKLCDFVDDIEAEAPLLGRSQLAERIRDASSQGEQAANLGALVSEAVGLLGDEREACMREVRLPCDWKRMNDLEYKDMARRLRELVRLAMEA